MKRIKPSAAAKSSMPSNRSHNESDLSSTYSLSEERISAMPLPLLAPLLRELNESSKRKMAQVLELSFARRGTSKWPEVLFAKSMLDLSARARGSREIRRKLAEALVAAIRPLLDSTDPAFSPERFDENPADWTLRYGKWHCYWALYFSSLADPFEEIGRLRLGRVAEETTVEAPPAEIPVETAAALDPAASPTRNEAAEQRRIEKLNKRIEALEERARREEERARRAEKESTDAKREAAKLQTEFTASKLELEAERRQNERLTEERESFAGRLAESKRQHKQDRGRLEEELTETRRIAEALESRIRTMQAEKESVEYEENQGADHTYEERSLPDSDSAQRPETPDPELVSPSSATNVNDAEEAIRRFDALLRRDLREAGSALPGGHEPGDPEARTHMRRALDLLDAVDAYVAGRKMMYGIDVLVDVRHIPQAETEARENNGMAEALEQFESDKRAEEDGQSGTFYRRDHGGYIVLENGESFNITESMVYKHQLQHEAEVLCMPRPDGHGGTQYEISLQFQGDDTFSPVRQYNGYAEQDEYGTWYAVDMNDADRRYPIHTRDLDIQRPVDGAPCIFNVGEEETVARLARVYRDFSAPDAPQKRESSLLRSSSSSSGKPKREGRKSKPEPFLQGCTVVVMGGQRKWFEDVVVESGAEYVHENGVRPDLIASDLRRAQALFLLITSTSHRASWESVELAKAAEIPYFIIQGSKSNLRSMLWENRDAIKGANRGDV
ncbi:hypothetical protein [Saccharibacillus sacchari]|uniref:Uncharacterized protein n=1 Tax=Saccharibacillus sacchari TaxID=456493 RepID=A0ACC6PC72_9BACL